MDHADDDDDVFVYMGGNQEVTWDVRRIRVHKDVKIITARAFQGCYNLVSIELHDGVEIIEKYAIEDCYSLRRIKLPGVRDIGNGAFDNSTSLTDVEFGNKLARIREHAFAYTNLGSIRLPKVRFIQSRAFA